MDFRRSLVVLFTVLCLTIGVLVGQTFRGSISGTVADPTGAAVAGATVKLVSPDTGLTREGVTSSVG